MMSRKMLLLMIFPGSLLAMQQQVQVTAPKKYCPKLGFYNDKTISVVTTDLKAANLQDLTDQQRDALVYIRTLHEAPQEDVPLSNEIASLIKSYIGNHLFGEIKGVRNKPKQLRALLQIEMHADQSPILKLFEKDFKSLRKTLIKEIANNLHTYAHNKKLLKQIKFLKNNLGQWCIKNNSGKKPYSFINQELFFDNLTGIETEKNIFNIATFMSLYAQLPTGYYGTTLQDSYNKVTYARKLLKMYPQALKGVDAQNPILEDIKGNVENYKRYFEKRKRQEDHVSESE